MHYAISAGAIVLRDARLLLVHHRGQSYDFWLPPGGRLRGEESILECAARETQEETSLRIAPERILYVEEFIESSLHFCKFWVLAPDPSGDLSLEGLDPDETHVVDVRFMSRDAMQKLTIYHRILRDTFWGDSERGFPQTRYLGLQRIG
jgi:ADP-ribose pyrophosphatase YjhB (NUDIX family)